LGLVAVDFAKVMVLQVITYSEILGSSITTIFLDLSVRSSSAAAKEG